jgi:hypothetical protein
MMVVMNTNSKTGGVFFMTLSSFIRFTGICSMIAGILFVSLAIWYNVGMHAFGAYLDLIGMLCLLLGLAGMYLSQAKAFGKPGFLIFLLAFFGAAMWTGHSWVNAFLIEVLETAAPEVLENPPGKLMTGITLSLYPFFLGLLLFGLFTAIKGILPRWPALILVIVPILDFVPYGSYVAQPLAGVALVWLGYAVWKRNDE